MSFLKTISLFTGLLLALSAEAGDDKDRFKPRDYKPSKTLRKNTYEPKTYAPKPRTTAKQLEGKSAPDHKPLGDTKALSEKPVSTGEAFKGQALEKPSAVDEKAYKPNEPLFPSTISADKTGAKQEKTPFLVSSNNAPFIVTERPKERNPLLEPRQGIKAPVETPESKDFSP